MKRINDANYPYFIQTRALDTRSTFTFKNIFSWFVWSPVQLPKKNLKRLGLVYLNFGAPWPK